MNISDSDKKFRVLGIDPSMRSTGVCFRYGSDYQYYIIAANPTKKLLKFEHPKLKVLPYEAVAVKDKNSIEKELAKTLNVSMVVNELNNILQTHQIDYIVMEAVAYAASGRIDELAGLNYCIRLLAMSHNIPIYVVPPTTNKLQFTGNGQATKEMMVRSWLAIDADARGFNSISKGLDDLADAFSLANFPSNLIIGL